MRSGSIGIYEPCPTLKSSAQSGGGGGGRFGRSIGRTAGGRAGGRSVGPSACGRAVGGRLFRGALSSQARVGVTRPLLNHLLY